MEQDRPEKSAFCLTRRDFLRLLPFLGLLPSCRLSLPPEKVSPPPEDCFLLAKGEAATFGRLSILNQSETFTLCLIPSCLSQERAVEAGLTTAPYQLAVYLLDVEDADLTTPQEEIAVTSADPTKKEEPASIIALEKILKEAKRERKKTFLNEEQFRLYLSLIISQVALVEIYNQAYSWQVSPEDQEAIKTLGKEANEFGLVYKEEMLKGQARPFIQVLSIKD